MFEDTLIVWRRTGKEHGEDTFRRNPPDVVEANLRRKAEAFRRTPASQWGWWRFSDQLLVERGAGDPDAAGGGARPAPHPGPDRCPAGRRLPPSEILPCRQARRERGLVD